MLLVGGPDLVSLGEAVLGFDNADKRGAMYLHEQLHRSLRDGVLPTFDDHQLFPVGIGLAPLNGYNSVEMWVSGLFRLFLPWPTWFNLAHLAFLPLNLLGFLPLGLRLFVGLSPALAAGTAWALSPWYLHEIAAGRLTQVVLFALPLAVWAWLGVMEQGRPRDRVWAGVSLGLLGISFWYYAYFLLLLLPVFLLVRRRPLAAIARDTVIAGGIALLTAGPLLLAVLWPRIIGDEAPMPPAGMLLHTRHYDSALQLSGPQPDGLDGAFPWVLAPGLVLGLLFARRRGLWLVLTLLCLVAALGPFQRVGATLYRLPYAVVWEHLPLLARMTNPGRWTAILMLPLWILCVEGLLGFLRLPRLGRREQFHRRAHLCWLVPFLAVVQTQRSGNLHLGHYDPGPPPLWAAVAEQAEGALIVVPVLFDAEACGWALFHGQPMLGGMVSSLPWAWPASFRERVEANGLLMQLYGLGAARDGALKLHQDDLQALRDDGFRHVVWDSNSWARVRPERRTPDPLARLREALGPPRYEDPMGAWWDLPAIGAPGASEGPVGLRLPEP